MNRVLPELFGRGEEALFERLREPGPEAALVGAVGAAAPRVLDAAELAVRLRRTGAAHLATLREELVPAAHYLYVPELFARATGPTGHEADRRSAR